MSLKIFDWRKMDNYTKELYNLEILITESVALLKIVYGYCQGQAETENNAAEMLPILRMVLEKNIQIQNITDKLYSPE